MSANNPTYQECICTPWDGVCLGEGYPDDPGTCHYCAGLDGEEPCPADLAAMADDPEWNES